MSQKKIDPSHIRAVQVSLDNAFLYMKSEPSSFVDDASLDSLESCVRLFKETISDVSTAITNFNDYLDSAADAFEEADKNLSSQIEKVTVGLDTEAQRYRVKTREQIRQNQYYNNI